MHSSGALNTAEGRAVADVGGDIQAVALQMKEYCPCSV